jgi:GH24 family phage-related lysozyme (muramidase)
MNFKSTKPTADDKIAHFMSAEEILNLLHNLDPNNEEHRNIYKAAMREMVKDYEDFKNKAYWDALGYRTIGVGFNMDNGKAARKLWEKAFHGTVDFDKAYKGEITLTNEQVEKLLTTSLEEKADLVEKDYNRIYHQLKLNERFVIEDLYYSSRALAGPTTNCFRCLHKYYETGNRKYLEETIYEIRERSNSDRLPGIKSRRAFQAKIMSSHKALFYSKPEEVRLPKGRIVQARLADTILPRGTEEWKDVARSSYYYIWRTKCDSKVQASHVPLEGKIFRRADPPPVGNPGDQHNCRCILESLPLNIQVVENKIDIRYSKKANLDILVFKLEVDRLKQQLDALLEAE